MRTEKVIMSYPEGYPTSSEFYETVVLLYPVWFMYKAGRGVSTTEVFDWLDDVEYVPQVMDFMEVFLEAIPSNQRYFASRYKDTCIEFLERTMEITFVSE